MLCSLSLSKTSQKRKNQIKFFYQLAIFLYQTMELLQQPNTNKNKDKNGVEASAHPRVDCTCKSSNLNEGISMQMEHE
jgi:hypothetical protein